VQKREDMTLVLSDEEVQGLLTIEMCLESLEQVYRELDQGRAINTPRCDIITKWFSQLNHP
jgi:hypothetical protein